MDAPATIDMLSERSLQARQGSTGARVYEVLREAIVQLKLRPGHLLSEADLAARLNVSRQPVREALIKLAEGGLVEVRPQRGTFVLLISTRAVETARFVREAVETAIVRKAAEAPPAGLGAILADTIARQRQAQRSADTAGFLRWDEEFHQALARGAECEGAWKVLETLKAQMDRVRFLSVPMATPLSVLIDQHEAIANAVTRGRPDEADAAMRAHLREIQKSLPLIAAEHPDLFAE